MFMLNTILKNFFTGHATRLYPFKKREPFPGVKGELRLDVEKCTFCTVCQIKCPSQCIQVDRKQREWRVDPFACVYCGVCQDVCPAGCLHHEGLYRPAVGSKTTDFYSGPPKLAAAPAAPQVK